jgi:polysaccharide chain length determinant protein (PEP-CTERM system associated)
LILSFSAVALLAVTIALLLPSVYRSEATILIEEQEVPEEFVKAPVTSYAEQRLQVIHQRIMSSVKLMEIIDHFGLYQNLKDKLTGEEIVEKMRQDTKMAPISVEVLDRRTGRPGMATIAFSLSYEGKASPNKVQQVANRLTSLFLDENLKVRVRQTEETSQFLKDEIARVKENLDKIESQIATFKKEHINQLPELLTVNVQTINDLERRIDTLNEQLKSQKEREGYLRTQLANVSPELETQREDKRRLEELKVQLVNLRSRFSERYPDVIKTKAEIAALEAQLADTRAGEGTPEELPDNPAYINLAAQLSSTQADIASINKQIKELREKEEKYRYRVEMTPEIEGTYRTLLSDRDTTKAKYNDLMLKLMESQMSHGLEKEQMGERFTLIDPPQLPEKPYKPNRLAIMLIGIVMGLGTGIGVVALKEFFDDTAYTIEDLHKVGPIPVLGSVPIFKTAKDIQRRRTQIRFAIAGSVVACIIGVFVFHYLIMDFDIFWVKLVRKFSLVLG